MPGAVVACALAVLLCGGPASAGTFRLYYLGGQSNMDGYGHVDELPEELADGIEGVWIFHGNDGPDGSAVDGRGTWSALGPGHGAGFRSDGATDRPSDRSSSTRGAGPRSTLLRREARGAGIPTTAAGRARAAA
jgi:iduronate 2-sulfatase